jgi:hypothetical protein
MQPVRRLRRYRVTVGRSLVIEVAGEGDEGAARQRAAKALIEDIARSPLAVSDVEISPISPDETLRAHEPDDSVEL